MYKIKNLFSEWYQPHESFVLRNPLFPVETFFKWKSEAEAPEAAREDLRAILREFYLQPVAQEALYIGSPDLHSQLLLWLDNKIEKADKKEKTELSLVKYMIRMCTRCTPYGLFATCTSGINSDKTTIQLDDKHSVQRHGRLDMDYVCEVHTYLLSQRDISGQILFYPNTSMYPLGDQLRYIEHRFLEKSGRSYHLVQIEKSIYLEKIMDAAARGATPPDLAALITDDEVSGEEALEFIYELIRNQVLVSELEPHVTGEEYFSFLLRKLKSLQHTEKYIPVFDRVVQEFENIKTSNEEDKYRFYSQLVERLKQLEIEIHLKTLIQVDSYRSASSCTLSKRINDDLMAGASLLQLLSGEPGSRDSFADFKNTFRNRYESQWIPLVEVLDTESGIGYGKFAAGGMEDSPLIDKLPIGNGQAAPTNHQAENTDDFLWQLYQQAITGNKTEVVIDDKIIEQFSKKEMKPDGLPDSMCMMFKILGSSSAELDNGNYQILLQPPSGPSGGNLLGRFCHLHPDIEQLSRTVLEEEATHHPDCIYAEIVHLPESRIGNILMRPVLRKYEIPYLCGSTLAREFQTHVTDLMVGVEDNRVVLRSKSSGKQVIPRMTTAHNFNMTTLPVYQFLCDLQYEQIRNVGFRWGILESRPFLPRVSYGKFILSKARWILAKEELKEMEKYKEGELVSKFSEWCAKKNIPEYILLSQGDNELMLHLRNYYCVKLLLSELNKGGTVTLTEALDIPGQCWITSPDGRHAGEFIAAFSRKITVPATPQQMPGARESGVQTPRYFPVGSEWLFAKIYCGTKTAEKILSEVLKPLTEELLAENRIDKYFFIRYHDESNHVRIRFHNSTNPDFWKEVVERLRNAIQPYMENHTVSNLQFETYQRELERYGFDTMQQSEDIFYHQSVSVLNFLSMLDGDEGEHYRWQVALKAADLFLEDFGYSLEQKRDLAKTLHKGFSDEFKVGPVEQKKISERFTSNRSIVQIVMKDEWEEDENLKVGIGVFKTGDAGYLQVIRDIRNATSVNQDIQQLNRLMGSYLHMFINRMFISNHRKVELVIYDYLLKYYESKMAKEKNKMKVTEPAEVNVEK